MEPASQPRRTNAMPRVTRGLWSALAEAFDAEDRADDDRRARDGLVRLQLGPAALRKDDYVTVTTEAGLALQLVPEELATVVRLDDYRRPS